MKPALEGSSIGVTKVKQADDLKHAWQAATEYCDEVFAERWIYGKEYTVAIVGNDVLPVIRLETPHQFYDYQAKYFSDDTNYICPCGLSEQQEQELAAVHDRQRHEVDDRQIDADHAHEEHQPDWTALGNQRSQVSDADRPLELMVQDPRTIQRATYLLWTAHDLERIADRATNIAERVIFLVTGKLVESGHS